MAASHRSIGLSAILTLFLIIFISKLRSAPPAPLLTPNRPSTINAGSAKASQEDLFPGAISADPTAPQAEVADLKNEPIRVFVPPAVVPPDDEVWKVHSGKENENEKVSLDPSTSDSYHKEAANHKETYKGSESKSSAGEGGTCNYDLNCPKVEKLTSSYSIGVEPKDKPLITYAYFETEFGRANLEFFIKHGLHDAADFIFILNGETDVDEAVIPKDKSNIKIVRRENKCFDLGAHAEVLGKEENGQALKDKYKYFILMNASIRGPFMPHWSRECWSDAYLSKVNDKVKLVGSTLNCQNNIDTAHVQSMIWATDAVGLSYLLQPEAIGMECFNTLQAAMNAEVRTTPYLRSAGFHVDVMMASYQLEKDYAYIDKHCHETGDQLWPNSYWGFNVHPFELIFMKSHRGIDDGMLAKMTEWAEGSGYSSYDVCKNSG
ncbi:hypothetical protein PVAG01_02264 [Phlyctema vagabunda]|uniref:Uncharacterized protein n=1 Tax=Phlyctema vagabunda TaxID=108571 RepID=A0ABR4PQ66_9HELO